MSNLLTLTALLFITGAVESQSGGPAEAQGPAPLFVRGVTVLDAQSGRLEPFRSVRIVGGRVADVGYAGELLPDAQDEVLDGHGAILSPGLAEMHGHLPAESQGEEYAHDIMFLYLSQGITTVRGMLGDRQQLRLRDSVSRGEVVGPRLIVGSPPMHGGSVKTPEEAKTQVAAFADAGYEHIKVHEGLKPDVYSAICEAAGEHGLRWGGHVSDLVGLDAALEAGQSTVDHLDNVLEATMSDETLAQYASGVPPFVLASESDVDRLSGVAESVVASGCAVVPTLVLFDTIFSGRGASNVLAERPECRYMPASVVDGWTKLYGQYSASMGGDSGPEIAAARRQAFSALHQAGATILMGTDSPQMFSVPGFSLRREVSMMGECGMSPLEVLQSGTVAVHGYLEPLEPFGVVPGARADFLLLRGNPLERVDALFEIEAVIHGGQVLSRTQIEEGLAAIEAKHR